MAEPRPAKFPEFARNDVADPTSSVNNVVEPSEAKKDLGHGPLGEFPPRQYMNWLHRLTYKWLKYLDEKAGVTGTFGCKTRSGDFDAVYNFTIRYTVMSDIVIIFFPQLIETSAAVTTRIQPEEETEFPSIIMPEDDLYVPCITMSSSTTEKPGYLRIESTPSSDWRFRIADSSAVIFDNFPSSGDKGWRAQCLMYKKDVVA